MKKRMQHMAGQFRLALVTLSLVLVVMLCVFMVVGCADDGADDILGDYKFVLCEVTSNAEKQLTTLRYDDGREWAITTNVETETADTLYRAEAMVLEDADGQHIALGGISAVVSPMPKVYDAKNVKHDPVEVITAWRTPRYVNMRLAIGRGGQVHAVGFSDEGIVKNPSGTKTKCLSLLHDQNGDPDYYPQEILMSCPVYQYAGQLKAGSDSIRFVIHTRNAQPYVLTTVY